MIKLDKIKIRTYNEFLIKKHARFNENFNPKTKRCTGLCYYSKNDKSIPFNIFIGENYEHNSLTIEFSSKILLDKYSEGISKETIRECLENLDKLGICEVDIDSILLQSWVTSIHVVKDIPIELTNDILNTLNSQVDNYRRFRWKHYEKSGIIFTKDVMSNKECIRIYNKEKELEKGENKKFLSIVDNPHLIQQSFKGKTRFEVELNDKDKIKNYLNIPDTHIDTVLSSTVNPILLQFDKIFENMKENLPNSTIDNYNEWAMSIVLKYFENNLKTIEQNIKDNSVYKSRSGLTDRMKQIREVKKQLECTTDNLNIIDSIREIL